MENKGIKNIFFGLLNQFIILAFGIILPRMFIMSYGSEVNGLISSANHVFTYLSLLEAGVGTATLQALYRPIAVNDRKSICSIMAATDKFYRRTGIVYSCCVIALAFIFPFALKTDIEYWTCCGIILFGGASNVLTYFFQAKLGILLSAEGKSYIQSNLSTFIYIFTSGLKIVFIAAGFNVLVVQSIYVLSAAIQALFYTLYFRKNYPWLNLSVKPDYQSIAQRNSVLVHKVTELIFGNTDVLILTFITGLKPVSVYTLYSSFFNIVKSALYSVSSGVSYAMGQCFDTNKEQFNKMFNAFETYYMGMTFAFYTLLCLMITPFLNLYVKSVHDIEYVDKWLPILFTSVFLLQAGRGPASMAINYAQHFKKTQNRAIAEAVINLSITIFAVFRYGIYGALIGTIAALLYRTNDMIIYSNKYILLRSAWVTYRKWLTYILLFCGFFYLYYRNGKLEVENYLILFIEAVKWGIPILFCYIVAALAVDKESRMNYLNPLATRFFGSKSQ